MPIKYRLAVFFILCLFVHGCASTPVPVSSKEADLQDLCSRHNIQWHLDSINQVVTLSRANVSAKILLGSSLVIVDNEQVTLSSPVVRKGGTVIVPSDFQLKVIDSLIGKARYAAVKFKRILIDAGHGGKDPGAIGVTGLKEKIVVLDIAKRLKHRLEKRGIDVVVTRETDKFISLEGRAKAAQELKADLFISIHANASRAKASSGLEVYYLRQLDRADKNNTFAAKNFKEFFDRFNMKKGVPALEEIILDIGYLYKQSESKKIADYIGRNTSDTINSKDRGSRAAGFFVLKNTIIPAVLVEVGFLSNRREEGLLKTSSYRQKIAEGLANSILEYVSQ